MYYVFIGYYIYKYRKHVIRDQRIPAITFVVCMLINIGLTWIGTIKQGVHCERFMEYGNPILVLAATMFFMYIIRLKKSEFSPGPKAKKIMDTFSGCSFGIYLIHILFLDNYKKHMEAAEASAWIVVPGLTLAIIIVSFGCIWLMKKTFGDRVKWLF